MYHSNLMAFCFYDFRRWKINFSMNPIHISFNGNYRSYCLQFIYYALAGYVSCMNDQINSFKGFQNLLRKLDSSIWNMGV